MLACLFSMEQDGRETPIPRSRGPGVFPFARTSILGLLVRSMAMVSDLESTPQLTRSRLGSRLCRFFYSGRKILY